APAGRGRHAVLDLADHRDAHADEERVVRPEVDAREPTAFEAVAPVRTGLRREHEDAAPEDAPAVVDRIAQLAGEAHAEDRLPGIAGGEPTSVEVVVVDAERERVGPAQRLREVRAPDARGLEPVHLHAAAR